VISFHSLATALGIASLTATTAVPGDDKPKIGTFSMTRTTTASYRIVPIDNGASFLEIREESGKALNI
jgi:hypothetical protein